MGLNGTLLIGRMDDRRAKYFDYSRYLFYLFLFTLPLPHVTAINNIGFYGCLLFFLFAIFKRELLHPYFNKVFFLVVFSYFSISLIGSFLHIETIGISLKAVKAHLFEQLFVLIYVLYFIKNSGKITHMLMVISISYIGIIVIPLYDFFDVLFSAGVSQALNIREIGLFDNYGINFQFYYPILLGSFFLSEVSLKVKSYWAFFLFLGFFFGVLYNTLTAIVLVFFYILFVFFLHVSNNLKIIYLLLASLSLIVFPYSLEKISSDINKFNKKDNYSLLSSRVAIWDVAIDCALDAPIYGYGYGQKKIKYICTDDKYVNAAAERGNFFGSAYLKGGKINFHNVYIESLFTTGWLGLLLLLGMFWYAILLAYRNKHFKEINRLLVIPIIVIFMLGSLMNGIWEGYAISKALMVFIGIGVYKEVVT